MRITRLAGALGAQLDDVDPRNPGAFAGIRDALLEHEVVFPVQRTVDHGRQHP